MSDVALASRAGNESRLAFFDVDGTLTAERDPYLYLHRCLGTEEQGKAVLADYLAGHLDYWSFCQRDVALWMGVEVDRASALLSRIEFLPVARSFADALRGAGYRLILISSGLDLHVARVASVIQASEWIANDLEVSDGRLAGHIRVRVGEGDKGMLAADAIRRYGANASRCVAVGDSESDLAMFDRVGHRVAVAPCADRVRQQASLVLGEEDPSGWLARVLGD